MTSYDFSSKNFKDFCSLNDISKQEGRQAVLDEINNLLIQLEGLDAN